MEMVELGEARKIEPRKAGNAMASLVKLDESSFTRLADTATKFAV